MIKPYCDFHTHTINSDGRLTSRELISKAYNAGIRVISITDHNFTEDLCELRKFAAREFEENMHLIQGAEISALFTDSKGSEHELHIVALGFDPDTPEMKALLAAHRQDRKPYIDAILQKLRSECGIDLGSYESIRVQFPDIKYIGRMILARLLVEKGHTSSIDESFDIYLGSHGQRRAYVKNPLQYSNLEDVIRTIIHSGGIPVLAHLLYYDLDNGNRTGGIEKELLLQTFKRLVERYGGNGGMEVYYARYKNAEERLYLLRMAKKHGLLISGGSDYHEQEIWESLEHRTSCSACSDLLEHLGVAINYSLNPAPIYVLSGFSGVGKGTICNKLRDRQIAGKPVALVQSYTNRTPRSSDDPYTFVSREEFTRLAQQNKFLEFNDAYAENGYGTPVDAVIEAITKGQSVLLEIDRVGLTHLLTDGKVNPNLVNSVFLVANAVDVAARLYQRGTETQSKIESRLKTAIQESNFLHLYDSIIENSNVNETIEAVIRAFEGAVVPNGTFVPEKFRADMELVLATH